MEDIGILICFLCFFRAAYLIGYEKGIIATLEHLDNDDY
jgi:hypothetical protein